MTVYIAQEKNGKIRGVFSSYEAAQEFLAKDGMKDAEILVTLVDDGLEALQLGSRLYEVTRGQTGSPLYWRRVPVSIESLKNLEVVTQPYKDYEVTVWAGGEASAIHKGFVLIQKYLEQSKER